MHPAPPAGGPQTRPATHAATIPAVPPRPVPGIVALEDGTIQAGVLAGAPVPVTGDLVFTTAATGWGEILTDPSYAGQIVVLTHPMAGSYRIASGDLESSRVHARGLIVTRLVTPPAGAGLSLEELLGEAGIPAITGIDTRALTLALRRGASRRGASRGDRTRLGILPPEIGARNQATVLCAPFAQDPGQLARVDVRDADDTVPPEITREVFLVAPVADHPRQVADDEAGGKDPARLDVLRVDAGIAHVRIRQCDDLSRIRRVGEDFLVAGDRGVEHHLADALPIGTDRLSVKAGAIGEREQCGARGSGWR